MGKKINSAVEWAVGIANDDSHGYDQIGRWGPDYDCSSLMISAWQQAGVPVMANGATYTGNMKNVFVKCGFKAIPFSTSIVLVKGDVLLNEKHHTCMYIGDGKIVQASCNEKGGIYNGKDGDQTGKEIAVGNYYIYKNGGWDYILRYENDTNEEVIKVNVSLTQVQLGSHCAEVGTLQTLLNSLGYTGKNGKRLTVDHQFGQNVEFAVKNFQKSHGIGQDGVVGQKTWTVLLTDDYA